MWWEGPIFERGEMAGNAETPAPISLSLSSASIQIRQQYGNVCATVVPSHQEALNVKMAALNRATKASYVIHDRISAETTGESACERFALLT